MQREQNRFVSCCLEHLAQFLEHTSYGYGEDAWSNRKNCSIVQKTLFQESDDMVSNSFTS